MLFLIDFSYKQAEVSAKIAPPVFRRPFASSVYIVAWALPPIMLRKRGRLKFWV